MPSTCRWCGESVSLSGFSAPKDMDMDDAQPVIACPDGRPSDWDTWHRACYLESLA
jgi:hypothetical protein